jgi:uncharacterized membrane protein
MGNAVVAVAFVAALCGVGYLSAEGHGWAAVGLLLAFVFAVGLLFPIPAEPAQPEQKPGPEKDSA